MLHPQKLLLLLHLWVIEDSSLFFLLMGLKDLLFTARASGLDRHRSLMCGQLLFLLPVMRFSQSRLTNPSIRHTNNFSQKPDKLTSKIKENQRWHFERKLWIEGCLTR